MSGACTRGAVQLGSRGLLWERMGVGSASASGHLDGLVIFVLVWATRWWLCGGQQLIEADNSLIDESLRAKDPVFVENLEVQVIACASHCDIGDHFNVYLGSFSAVHESPDIDVRALGRGWLYGEHAGSVLGVADGFRKDLYCREIQGSCLVQFLRHGFRDALCCSFGQA